MSRFRSFRAALFAAAVLASASVASAEPDSILLERGRLSQGGQTLDAGAAIAFGTAVEVAGTADATVSGPGGLRFRAIPQTRFRVDRAGDRLTIQLDRGAISATSTGAVEVFTPSGAVQAEGARFIARLQADGLYVEHRQESTGRVATAAPGAQAATLAAGASRTMALPSAVAVAPEEPAKEPAKEPAPEVVEAPKAEPVPTEVPPVREPDPALEVTPRGPEPAPVEVVPEVERTPEVVVGPPPVPGEAVEPPAAPPGPPPVPGEECAPTTPPPPATAPAPPAPCAKGTCPPVVVSRPPMRAPLGGPCCNRAEVECGPVPYVHYAEGCVGDVLTMKVGYVVATVRPASRVVATRLPDGSVMLRNRDRDLVLVVLDSNQFSYIGGHGSLVLSPDGQVECFRGLVHLYRRAGRTCFGRPHGARERVHDKKPFGGR